ncbi:MAG: CDP-2,3-bis-(O-geranylgeranyl)-sn-glycerol synthase [Candidatus Thermoplasmatota archaeon]|nr:CDP-2,3-bis-(O-geranylgeranyl)-sn-glycerol synthase [Euryarchaeota archaeon]MBU4031742.1 CDP-2,3-bis-(O-geranylgeranyl)-sn-glycerol synthase [Candidatus Thermoplasmatota archaeon]MBU4143809.1 CDP-2,3-bis-(O-geranylgeranyl)-sn-glycerol synthase [Candidatus Thermoplasmatota archaeon]MBU4591594.1 CDP-2,3-bis-(O-geranylgeranyl)-sn-glycerol synthase [Candidatus Thermoplasmatota archaeon]
MDAIFAILRAVWLMVPMLIPNSAAVLFGGGTAIDFGRTMKDGTRILGDGKTWNGLIGGTLSGMGLGMIQIIIMNLLDVPSWTYGVCVPSTVFILFLLAFGSMFGDMLGSFIKRRIKVARGAKAPGLDQYDFLIGTLILIIPLQWAWFRANFLDGVYLVGFIGLIILIPIMHRVVNIIGFKMGKKDVPW